GAYLYGVSPSSAFEPAKPAVAFRARVAQARMVKKGELVGYDDFHPLKRDTLVATISAGYVDGYPRKGGNGFVEINGYRSRVLGIACMDQMMADVTDAPSVRPGDVATLFGGGITLDEYAALHDLNRNEAISTIGSRVPRVYKQLYD
ncbi:MAG: alanine racemase C-terminal domain-containing protein, partial [Clostridia bacterium]|nr:alanine racemase C-terminal domain-containing protein [Clostridia bacterium]